ncbi:MAG: ABC transporter ATP-binding protein [Candidatus Dojkabacteria bacterium]
MKQKESSLFKLLWFAYKKYFVETKFVWQIWAFMLLSFLVNLYPLVISYFLARVIDISIEAVSNGSGFEMVAPTIVVFSIISIVWVVINNLFSYLGAYIDLWSPFLEDQVYLKKYVEIEPQAYENSEFIKNKSTLSWNSWAVRDNIIVFVNILASIPVVIISFFAIYQQVPVLALFAVIGALPIIFIIKNFGMKIWDIWSTKGEEKIIYSNYKDTLWETNFEKMQEVSVFGYGKFLLQKALDIGVEFNTRIEKNFRGRYVWSTVSNFFSEMIYIFVLVYSIKMVFSGDLSIGMVTFVIAVYDKFGQDTKELLERASSIVGNKKLFEVFFNVLNWKSDMPKGNKSLPVMDNGLSLEFKNIWFKYPNTDRWILENVNFKINKDEDIALVGKNGAGKSTIIKLLLRIYDPDKGEILINGLNIKEIELESYYKQVGILSQSFNTLEITVEDNIFLGKVTGNKGEDIREAAKAADIHDTILTLPKKYKTFLCRGLKGGAQLSGGQWQKLAIARAFFRNAKLLVLDEPTSAIDSIAEERIFENIAKNSEDKTTLIVSHRFATVRKADRILVVDNGHIVEDGNHSTLLKNNRLYAEMYSKQAGAN